MSTPDISHLEALIKQIKDNTLPINNAKNKDNNQLMISKTHFNTLLYLIRKKEDTIQDLEFRLRLAESRHDPIDKDKPMTLDKCRRMMNKNDHYEDAFKNILRILDNYSHLNGHDPETDNMINGIKEIHQQLQTTDIENISFYDYL